MNKLVKALSRDAERVEVYQVSPKRFRVDLFRRLDSWSGEGVTRWRFVKLLGTRLTSPQVAYLLAEYRAQGFA